MNKSFVITLLFAAVDAEDGYACTDSTDTWFEESLANPGDDVTTADLCKAACDAAIEGDNKSGLKD